MSLVAFLSLMRTHFLNRSAFAASFYEVYTETYKHNDNAFSCRRKSDDQEFFVKRVRKESHEPQFAEQCVSRYNVKYHEYVSPFLVLEHLDGGDLLSFINSNTLEVSEIFILLKDMLSGLAVLHDNGIIHCDIKPENFVFAESDCAIDPNVQGNIKLVDYGSARKSSDTESELTGTLPYVAPEVFERSKVSEKSDVYALGCIAFLLVTGEPLVDPSLSDEEIVKLVMDENFPNNRFKGTEGDLLRFVRLLVSRDPKERPTVQQALAELETVALIQQTV